MDLDTDGMAIRPEVVDQELAQSPKEITGQFRKAELLLPREIGKCAGISLFGRVIRSFVFSTDLAIIRNCDADAVLAVYPFTCQPSITQGVLNIAERPVFAGVAGSKTTGVRSVELAMQSEMQGATGVVVNAATRPAVVTNIARAVDIPVVITIGAFTEYACAQIEAGAQIVNVSAGKDTPAVVEAVRNRYPDIPIIASGGGTDASIAATVKAGADAISWTPPTMRELERANMDTNRGVQANSAEEFAQGRVIEDSEVFKAAAKAAEDLSEIEPEARQAIAQGGAQRISSLFDEHLDANEQLLFRQLLSKLFVVPVPGSDEAAAQQVAPEDGGH